MNQKGKMKIGELVARSGMPRHMIHYYLNQGLLHQPERINRTLALYSDSHLQRLKVIKQIKRNFNSPLSFILSQFDKKDSGNTEPNPDHVAEAKREKPYQSRGKKEKIIDVAIEQFSANGYQKTSIKDITGHLGLSPGVFYIYFKSKQDLFNQVVVKAIKNTADQVEKSVQKEKDFFLRNLKRLEALKELYPRFSEVLIQLRAQAVNRDGHTEPNIGEVYYEISKPFIKEIHQALELGLIRSVDPDLLMFCMIGMCDMLLLRSSLDKKYDLSQIIDFMSDMMLNGLKPDRQSVAKNSDGFGPGACRPDLTPEEPTLF
jgi:AcrR family transcriptional regulator